MNISTFKQVTFVLGLLALMVTPTSSWGQSQQVVNTLHNLSASGAGTVKAATEQQVCIFCHAAHNSSAIEPLWNRNMPTTPYTPYTSSSMNALPGQPTGQSKMCLSCHDGTIALGNIVSHTQAITMAGGVTTLPAGNTNLGTDLSNDHPISFQYTAALVASDPKLKDPATLPPSVKLDANAELQCTSCHNVHDNTNGKFLAMDNTNSQLCKTCHQPGTTQVVGHQQCLNCHQPHNSPSGPFLLIAANVRSTCLSCHDAIGGPTGLAPDINQDMAKIDVHDTNSPIDQPNPIPFQVKCTDCHQPHTINKGVASAPTIRPNFGQIDGINNAAAPVDPAANDYEVCFKCHSNPAAVQPWVTRQIVQNNTRLEFSPNAISSHPVTGIGKSTNVPSLLPGWTVNSIIYCTNCHGSDPGGTNGAHGSINQPLLIKRYDTADFTVESAQAYALCYTCHSRTSILNDDSFKEHKKHILGENAPCSACHDSHGISSTQGTATKNAHLINIDTTIAAPSQQNGRFEFIDRGNQRGECSLSCHGKDHNPWTY